MSIADQNFDILEKIYKFKPKRSSLDTLLHHSMTEILYIQNDLELEGYDARFCIDNWQSGIIVTSFVKLFDSMFKAGSKQHVHRFVALSNSIIILDEVQAIPSKFYPLLRIFMQLLTETFRTYIILMTATQPDLLPCLELVRSPQQYFERLSRIYLTVDLVRTELAQFHKDILYELSKSKKNHLIILNTIRAAKKTFSFLCEHCRNMSVEYLSAELIPAVRVDKLARIKKILNTNQQVILISTQVVEAGIDIDFDVVIRDLAPLDAIIQSAGRCNRNNGENKGEVRVICLTDDKRLFGTMIYGPVLIETTKELFKKSHYEENELFALSQKYYQLLNKRHLGDDKLLHYLQTGDFKKMCENFTLIDEQPYKSTYIVDWDEHSHNLLSQLQDDTLSNIEDRKRIWRNLAPYRVDLGDRQVSNINTLPVNQYMADVKVITRPYYDENGIKESASIIL